MPIKNYTTKVDPYTSLGEIQGALARSGAGKIMIEYADDSEPLGITFALATVQGNQLFRLIAPVEGTLAVFRKQKVKADIKQAQRTAWRNVRDWVLAQIAYAEAVNAETAEIFFPYLVAGKTGQTIYQQFQNNQLALSAGEETIADED